MLANHASKGIPRALFHRTHRRTIQHCFARPVGCSGLSYLLPMLVFMAMRADPSIKKAFFIQ